MHPDPPSAPPNVGPDAPDPEDEATPEQRGAQPGTPAQAPPARVAKSSAAPEDKQGARKGAPQRSARGSNTTGISGNAAYATAVSTATAAVTPAPSHDPELQLFLRRAAWLGHSTIPYVSFTSLFLGFFVSKDPTSRWVQSKAPWIGPQLDDVIRRWKIRAPMLRDLGPERVREAKAYPDDDLPLQYETSPSASTMLRAARSLAAEVGDDGSLGPRHLLAAYVYRQQENALDLAAWKLDAEAWATRFLGFVVDAYPDQQEAWQALHDRFFPRPHSASIETALRWASLRAAEARAELDASDLLEGLVLAGLVDAKRVSSAGQLVSYLGAGVQRLELDAFVAQHGEDLDLSQAALPPSAQLAAIFARARVFATATPEPASAETQPTLHARHLIAALLTDRRPLPAFGLLHRSGRTRGGVLAQFSQWLCQIGPGNDDRERWRALFDEHRDDVLSGYHNDEAHGEDRLDITRDVRALAAVIASTQVTPPLSVGLFGDWGSGKSFFMGKLRERIELLASAAKAGPEGESWFCGKRGAVVQIDFNAWHYLDADLWSSLAVRVFDELSAVFQRDFAAACRAKLTSLADREQALEAERAAAAATAAGLEELLRQQREVRETREVRLRDLVKRAAEEQARRIKEHPEVAQVTGQLKLEGANVKRELQAAQRDLQYVGGRAELWWRTLSSPARAITLLLVLGLPLLTGVIVATYVNTGGTLVAALATLTSTLTGLFAKVRGFTRRVAGRIDAAVSEVSRIEQAVRDEKTPAELEVEAERDGSNARIAELEREQLAVAKRKAELEAELAALQQGDAKTLREFILERAAAQDYRKHLGTIAAVHNDFRDLSNFLAPSDDGPNVERIVLYIDDLDRCPPRRVVEVLQAIHIILSLPLFVVVVGVDSRWLLDSLSAFYHEQFPKDAVTLDVARPQQYLEKIFQVPFTLTPMSEAGYGALVGGMLEGSDDAGDGDGWTAAPAQGEPGEAEADARAATTARAGSTAAPRRAAPRHIERIDLRPRALQLEPEELAYLKTLGGLVPTPRAAKRLVNLYRIVRASLDDEELFELLTGRYRLIQLCLALVIGNPAFGAELFREILSGRLGSRGQLVDWLQARSEHSEGAEPRVLSALEVLRRRHDEFASWPAVEAAARRVGRFSFETGRTLSLRAPRLHERGAATAE